MPRPYPSVRSGQHAGWAAVLENGDGMLEVRRERPVLGHHRPFVVQGADVRTADVHHGLDGERHAGHEPGTALRRSEEHTSELQSLAYLVCRLLLEKNKT